MDAKEHEANRSISDEGVMRQEVIIVANFLFELDRKSQCGAPANFADVLRIHATGSDLIANYCGLFVIAQ